MAQAAAAPDPRSDTWVGVDGLGRRLPTFEEVGPPRPDRFVALFYFLWLGQHDSDGPYDVTKILTEHPEARDDGDNPAWGPMGHFHHWSEPYFGYYTSDDRYVLRKHAHMLADAGVDVIIFDTTNNFTYATPYHALLETFADVRAAGGNTPQIAFLAPFGDPTQVATSLYADIYQPGLHQDLWFQWKGKPLILADPAALSGDPATAAEIRDFFTFRKPQPSYFDGPTGPDQWGWLENYPQHVFTDAAGNAEQMTVGVAQNAVDGRLGAMTEPRSQGRSYHGGQVPTDESHLAYGLNLQEQWDRALAVDPELVFVTGWNEWVAQRFTSFNGIDAPVVFVDEFDWEHSRDIEPMKGGFGDAYYYQLAANIRRYKGVRPQPEVSAPVAMPVDGHFGKWAAVGPEFLGHPGATAHRDHPGCGTIGTYTNDTGRNNIVLSKVARDRSNVYFYVQTRDRLTPYTDADWMMLFIGVHGTGWEGFDFVVNRRVKNGHRTWLERSTGGWHWRPIAEIGYAAAGRELELAVPRAAIGALHGPLRIDFSWIDNAAGNGDITDVIGNGDKAPSGRFRYRYQE